MKRFLTAFLLLILTAMCCESPPHTSSPVTYLNVPFANLIRVRKGSNCLWFLPQPSRVQ